MVFLSQLSDTQTDTKPTTRLRVGQARAEPGLMLPTRLRQGPGEGISPDLRDAVKPIAQATLGGNQPFARQINLFEA